jgi:glucose dehydrogenase
MARMPVAAYTHPNIRSTTGNVGRLTVAWTYRTGELDTYAGTNALEKACL